MKPFRKHKGSVVPLNRTNIDTDIIIPKEFLKRIERTGFGQFLMHDWRFQEDGEPREDFVLNFNKYQEASILLTGENFGSGSSRENAVWALQDYGFQVIIAPSFADIFRINCSKNGLLLIELEQSLMNDLFEKEEYIDGYTLQVDLQEGIIKDQQGWSIPFTLDSHTRHKFLNGLDDIALTLEAEDNIKEFEKNRPFYMNPTTI
ncbi:3-isopropylmalate dehydratase small subunit [Halobacillus amylolyticus]|uniref:3-isopropylmalate dehydratase small subunit n=1 Tax=Halobacillus amylolyticus TaxID=2932259 RepID=A0ABY4HGQ7_9BACI|nr:3-isopropylmalate dehydratase small subunit [Halobacillus amylolyticus]UOR13558.1 3-isopropylmalate dehydratase small subunit [Halobacillus amylolyticus]